MNKFVFWRRGCAALVGILLVGCTESADPPSAATVIVEASAEVPLMLVVSTRFEVVGGGEIVLTTVDSVPITENFNETYQLNSEGRFTAILANDDEELQDVRLSVLLDGRVEYDERATLAKGGFLQFLYRFRDGNIY